MAWLDPPEPHPDPELSSHVRILYRDEEGVRVYVQIEWFGQLFNTVVQHDPTELGVNLRIVRESWPKFRGQTFPILRKALLDRVRRDREKEETCKQEVELAEEQEAPAASPHVRHLPESE